MPMDEACEHVKSVTDPAPTPRTPDGCEECLQTGGEWIHLRLCMQCSHVGCCSESPNKHSVKHFEETGHAVIRSYEPGEDWWYCFADDAGWVLEDTPPAPSYS